MDNKTQQITDKKWLRTFAPIWTGQAFSLFGSNLVQFALVWWLTEKTGSTAVLATATLVALLPEVLLGPIAGALIDRWSRRKVMIVADSAIALVTLGLVILFLTGAIQTWHIYAAMFLRALGGAFHFPAMAASSSLMVPEKHLARLAGANQALRGMMSIAAPPLGALLLSILPMHNILAIDILTAMLAVLPLLFIAIPQPASDGKTVTVGLVLRDVRDGFAYVASWPALLSIIVMATVLNFLFNPAFAFLPLMVTQHFQGGAAQFGWLESAFGVGLVLGGILLGIWGGFRRKITTMMAGVFGMGLAILAIGLAPANGYWMALGGMWLVGFMNSMTNGSFFALMQTKIEPEKQGRVFTMIGSMLSAMSPISMIIAAPVAEWLGLQSWYILGGIFCLLMTAGCMLNKTIMTIDSHTNKQQIGAMQAAAASSD